MISILKKILATALFICVAIQWSWSQEWMKSLEVAKKLAVTQNKMLFVMWEEATQYALPVYVIDNQRRTLFVEDMLLNEDINTAIWDMFVPVLLNETAYDDMYEQIKDSRSYGYLQLFRDDSIKIMDANGNILNTAYVNYNSFNFNKFVNKYGLHTEMLSQELRNYSRKKDFYSAFYLGAKYVDFAIYNSQEIRPELIELSNIYLKEASVFMDQMSIEEKQNIELRYQLVKIKQDLILNKSRKVIRLLNRIDQNSISSANKDFMAFLYFTAYKLENDLDNINLWKSEISLRKIKEANFIYKNLR